MAVAPATADLTAAGDLGPAVRRGRRRHPGSPRYTDEQFGSIARRRYEALLITALQDLAVVPVRPGSIERPELGQALRSYHLRHSRQRARIGEGMVHRPRHLFLYRLFRPQLVGVGRVLYDVMDLDRHLTTDYGDGR